MDRRQARSSNCRNLELRHTNMSLFIITLKKPKVTHQNRCYNVHIVLVIILVVILQVDRFIYRKNWSLLL
jgi:hypothetical protein